MQILCKVKDFYDYACVYEQKIDKFPTYERMEYSLITQSDLTSWILDMKRNPDCFEKSRIDDFIYFYLEVGRVKYIFKAFNFTRFNICPAHTKNVIYRYDCKISLVRTIEDSPKTHEKPLVISRICLNYSGIPHYKLYKHDISLESCPVELIIFKASKIGWKAFNKDFDIIETPIMKETCLPALLEPFKIYNNLDNYLRSLFNDVDCESAGITDKERAVNKGFNNKESFRNIHPRT